MTINDQNFRKLLALNGVNAAHCMIAHIALMTGLSYMFSNSILTFSFFTGLYLMAMGWGTLLVEKLPGDAEYWQHRLWDNGICGVLLANPGVLGLLFLNEIARGLIRHGSVDLSAAMLPLGIILTLLIGMVSGAELPIFSKISENAHWDPSRPLTAVLTSDYFGAVAGILIFTLLLNPFFGLIRAIVWTQTVTATLLAILAFTMRAALPGLRLWPLVALNIYVWVFWMLRTPLMNALDALSGW